MNTSKYDQGISWWGISVYQVCQGPEDSHLMETMSTSESTVEYGKYQYMRRDVIQAKIMCNNVK